MGALHEGHLSLVRLSKMHTDITVVSIFVNPTQFGPSEDFSKYPRTIEQDMSKLVEAEVEFLFLPEASEIYQKDASTSIVVDGVTAGFEGAIRPGHFSGVATVVASLFNIVQPSIAYFGQKDAQQVAVVKRMVRDLHIPVKIEVGDIIREDGKLALSSRNRYLNDAEHLESLSLSQLLTDLKQKVESGTSWEAAKTDAIHFLEQQAPNAALDYLEAVDSETFQKLTSFGDVDSFTAILAVRFRSTRLLDNIVIRLRG